MSFAEKKKKALPGFVAEDQGGRHVDLQKRKGKREGNSLRQVERKGEKGGFRR